MILKCNILLVEDSKYSFLIEPSIPVAAVSYTSEAYTVFKFPTTPAAARALQYSLPTVI